jgi:hypothetical protein
VQAIAVDSAGGLRVSVAQAVERVGGALLAPAIIYRLDAELRFAGAEPADGYAALVDQLVRAGTLSGAFARSRVGREIASPLLWNGSRFVPTPLAPR